MPQEERINSYVDLSAIEKETKIFVDNLNLVVAKMAEISKSAEANGIALGKAVPKDVQTNLQQTNKLMTEAVEVEKKMTTASIQYEKAVEEAKQARQAYNYELKKTVEAETAAEGSLKQMRAQLSLVNKQYDALSKAERENAAVGGQLLKQSADLTAELKKLEAATGRNQRNVGNYGDAIKIATMSLGEMRRTLKAMKNADVSTFNPAQLAAYNKNMALLTDGIGDYNARLKAAGDSTENMISAMNGLVGVAQVGLGVMSAFGIENKNLEKTMITLMSVSQGLSSIHKMNEAQTLKVAAATIKDSLAKAQATVATFLHSTALKGEAIAQNAATASTKAGAIGFKLLGKAMSSIPLFAIIAGLAALATGIIAVVNWVNRETDAERQNKIVQESLAKTRQEAVASTQETQIKLRSLLAVVNDHTKAEGERQTALDSMNQIMGTTLTLTDDLTGATEDYIAALISQAQADAIVKRMADIKNQLADVKKLTEDAQVSTFDKIALGLNDLAGLRAWGSTEERKENARVATSVKDLNAEYDALNSQLKVITDTTNKNNQAQALAKAAAEAEAKAIDKQKKSAEDAAKAYDDLKKSAMSFYEDLRKASLDEMGRLDDEYNEKFKKLDDYYKQGFGTDEQYQIAKNQLIKEYVDKAQKIQTDAAAKDVAEWEKTYDAKAALAKLNFNEMLKYIDGQLAAEDVSQEDILMLLDKKRQAYFDYYDALLKAMDDQAAADGEITAEEIAALDKLTKARDEYAEKTTKGNDDIKKSDTDVLETVFKLTDGIQNVWGAYLDITQNITDRATQHVEDAANEQLEILQNQLDQQLISQAQYDAASAGIEEQADRRKAELARKQANREKALAMFNVAITQAQAVMKFLVDPGGVIGIVFSALAATTGALQLAAIASEPLPAYAEGRKGGKAETAIVGEAGREVIKTDKGFFLTPNAPTLVDLPAGADVIPNDEVARLMSGQMIHDSLPDQMLGGKIDNLAKIMKEKELVKFEITRAGMALIAQNGLNKTRYINQNLRR